ncbi:MAG: BatA domain-containing protein [Isosphaeraceae bacterium]
MAGFAAIGPIFALGFANVAMLGGLAAASIPIILHLLNRRKFRERSWAAMRFLAAAMRKNQRRIRIEQLILLAIRTLIIVLLVGAMARPFLEKFGAILPGQRTHRVLVLDGSMSMSYTTADQSRFDSAKALAQRLVKEARQGDSLSVVLLGAPPRVVVGSPSANLGEVSKEIGEIEPTHQAVDLGASFEAIERVLAASDVRQKEIVFLTDLQAASWTPRKGAEDVLKKAIAQFDGRGARSSVIDLGSANGENRGITSLRLNTPVVTATGPAPVITATVKNFGREPANPRVRLAIDGQVTDERPADGLEPGEERAVSFVAPPGAAGDHLVEAIIDDDPLKVDNHRWIALSVRDRLRALLIDGDRKAEAFESEADYLAQALDPADDTSGTPSPVKADVAGESQLRARPLSEYDVVVLANVPQFTADEAALLEAYLKQGGGLVVFLGDKVIAENYNRVLFRDGDGPLPARIGDLVGNANDRSRASFRFDPLDFVHPIVSDYKGNTENVLAGLTGVKTLQYAKLEPASDSTAIVALGLETGDPAVMEMAWGRGIVYLIATTADSDWTDWPLHPSFPPVMQQIAFRAAAGKQSERNVVVGKPLDLALPASGEGAPATVVTPSSRSVPGKLVGDGDISRFRFEETDLSGPYRVKVGPPLVLEPLFAANPDPAEGSLEKLDSRGLATAIPGWEFQYFDDWRKLMQAPAAIGKQGEMHRPLLFAVLILLFAETVLAWLFGHHR